MKSSVLLIVSAMAGAVLLGIGYGGTIPTRMLNAADAKAVAQPQMPEPASYAPTYRFVEQGPLDLSPLDSPATYDTQYATGPDQEPMPIYSTYGAELADGGSDERNYPEPDAASVEFESAAPTVRDVPAEFPDRESAITVADYGCVECT